MNRYTVWNTQKIRGLVKPVRKPVDVQANQTYREIGIRSHGNGVFYKDEVLGLDLGNKRVFWIEPDCFVVNIVFAWEQAVAKTTDAEVGMIASHRFPMYKPIKGKVDLDYLLYFFKTPYGKHLLELASPGGAGRNKTLGQEAFLDLSIPIPPIEEQRKIAQILSTWDEAIRLTQDLIAAKEQHKKGLMQRLLTGQVRFPGFEERPDFQETRFGQLPLDWQYVSISKIAHHVSKKNTENKTLTVLSCTKHDGLVDSLEYFGRQIFSNNISTYKVVKRGQFAYATNHIEEGSIGYQDLHDEALISPMYTVFETNDEVNDPFLYRVLKTELYRHIFEISTNGTVNRRGSLRWPEFSTIKIPLPSLKEQERIAEFFNICDREIQLLQQKLAALQQQKKGLMQRLLTGQVRVPLDKPAALVSERQLPALTSAEAFIIWLIAQYQPRKYPHPSRVEVQKLVYFAQEAAGLPADHSFFDWSYGPFSKDLHQRLARMDGRLITGFAGGEPRQRKEIAATPEAVAAADAYLSQYLAEQGKLAFVQQLVKGFETPRQMELLSTVHWVMKKSPGAPFLEVVHKVHEWNKHKQSFKQDQIRKAWKHLLRFGVAA